MLAMICSSSVQSLARCSKLRLDLGPRLTFGRFHLLQVRFENRLSFCEHTQEALGVSGTRLPVFANEYVRHIPIAQALVIERSL
jgi:hypothetical protein